MDGNTIAGVCLAFFLGATFVHFLHSKERFKEAKKSFEAAQAKAQEPKRNTLGCEIKFACPGCGLNGDSFMVPVTYTDRPSVFQHLCSFYHTELKMLKLPSTKD